MFVRAGAALVLGMSLSACDGGDPADSGEPNTFVTLGEVAFTDATIHTNGAVTCAVDVAGSESSRRWLWHNVTRAVALDGEASTITLTYAAATPGETLRCTVTVTDADGASHIGSATAVIANRAPEIASVTAPTTVTNTDALPGCEAQASDPDGGPISATSWWENAANAGAPLPDPLSPSVASPGDTLTCHVTASDAQGAVATTTASATVTNRAPTVGTPAITPAPAYNDATLTCAAVGADPDGTTPSVAYAWTNETQETPLGDGPTVTLDPADAAPGDLIRCTATASDGALGSGSTTADVTAIENQPPTFTTTTTAITVTEDAAAFELVGFVDAWDPGAPVEAGQAVHFEVVVDEPHPSYDEPYYRSRVPGGDALFAADGAPTVTDDGDLHFTLAPDEWGFTGFTVVAVDDRGATSDGVHVALTVEGVADDPVENLTDLSYTAFENTKCVEITLDGLGQAGLETPLVEVTALPSPGTLYHHDPTKPFGIGAAVVLGAVHTVPKRVCFQPVQHDHSVPPNAVYATFGFALRTDYDITLDGDGLITAVTLAPDHVNAPERNDLTVSVIITPVFFPP